MPDSTTVADCYAIAAKYDLLRQFPASVRELFERRALEETPKQDDENFRRRSLAGPCFPIKRVIAEASKAAAAAGFTVEVDNQLR